MSDTNNSGWPFGEQISDEGLDISAIFGGEEPVSDVNPFDTLTVQVTEPAEPAVQPQAEEPPAEDTEEEIPVSESEPESTDQPAPPLAEDLDKTSEEIPAEDANPIEEAFARQEEKTVQAKAKSLFEKAPIFSYGSAREDITDPAQTFEELRIAKSDDFPELSEGKRVSWSVEYGKVTRAITDPQGHHDPLRKVCKEKVKRKFAENEE